MCDNTAVRWSDWESEKSRIESDTRNAINEKLLKQLVTFESNGYPESFLQGFARALEVVRAVRIDDTPYDTEDYQQSLFD